MFWISNKYPFWKNKKIKNLASSFFFLANCNFWVNSFGTREKPFRRLPALVRLDSKQNKSNTDKQSTCTDAGETETRRSANTNSCSRKFTAPKLHVYWMKISLQTRSSLWPTYYCQMFPLSRIGPHSGRMRRAQKHVNKSQSCEPHPKSLHKADRRSEASAPAVLGTMFGFSHFCSDPAAVLKNLSI